MDSLGNTLALMTVVIVVGCLAWAAIARVVAKRRLQQIRQEFGLVPDEELVTGIQDLRRAVLLRERGERP